MINQSDVIAYAKRWFDWDLYIEEQKNAILERILHFSWKLYLEIWGKFLMDAHASRVLPWFYPDTKKKIFADLIEQSEIVFCVNAKDIVKDRQLSNEAISYVDYVFGMLADIKTNLDCMPKIAINMCNPDLMDNIEKFEEVAVNRWYEVYKRYIIDWYPSDLDKVISKEGFWKDDYIKTSKKLILVTWAASNSGKMSTCMGQLFMDKELGMDSWYAKYETFPIWNIALDHPINLAYEAATADIDDCNCYDTYHFDAYWIQSVNYNRDVDAFPLLQSIIQRIVWKDNRMKNYRSATDMWISRAGFCLLDDEIIKDACYKEIERRKSRYEQMLARWEWDQKWIERCDELLAKI